MAGRMQVRLDRNAPLRSTPRRDSAPMRLLVLGAFGGDRQTAREPLADRPTLRVDAENLDHVLQRVAPRLELPTVGELRFASLDDFHPDRLHGRLEVFRALRELRTRPAGAGEGLLAGLLGKAPETASPAAARPAPADAFDALVRQIVAPHVVRDTSARDDAYRAALDAATSEQMRALLHQPAFQALEAAWRGVHWLVSTLELDENLQLHLMDVTRAELLADVVAAEGRLAQTGLHRALADRWRNVPGGEGWTALALLERFGAGDTDIGLLAALGLIASQAGGPLLAEADLALAGGDAAALAGWNALRASEAAPWIGLAAPRLLLRRPYGRRSDPVEAFAFEEILGAPEHEHLLWGNPALALLNLVGRAFSASGWNFEPGDEREIGDLPAYTFERDGERLLQPCAEHWLGERSLDAMLAAGLTPLASHRQRNALSVARLQSVADPPQPLAGLARGA